MKPLRPSLIRPALAAYAWAAAILTGCARPADQIATALTRYGLAEPQAICVGDRLGRNLSIAQLRELSALARAYREKDPEPDKLTIEDFARVSVQVRDPQVPIAVARAAAACRLLY